MCGALLMITPWNDYQCCGACTKIIESVQKKVQNSKPGTVKPVNPKVVHRATVRRQVEPLPKDFDEMV